MDIIVKREEFLSIDHKVKLLTVENGDGRYYSIIKDGKVQYISPVFQGGSQAQIVYNCDSALQVVRKLLADTQFLVGEVVGA